MQAHSSEAASAFHVFRGSLEHNPTWHPSQDPEYSRMAAIHAGDYVSSSAASEAALCSEYNLSPSW